MRKKIVVANWKMNPESLKEAGKIFSGLKKFSRGKGGVEVVICPPDLYLIEAKKFGCLVGGQDVAMENKGAHTGEVSARMLKQNGASYVIVGHSERRALGESDEIV